MATAKEIKGITGLQIDLSVEEAQGLFDLLFRGVGSDSLTDLKLVEVLAALRWSGVVEEGGANRPYFKEAARLEG